MQRRNLHQHSRVFANGPLIPAAPSAVSPEYTPSAKTTCTGHSAPLLTGPGPSISGKQMVSLTYACDPQGVLAGHDTERDVPRDRRITVDRLPC